MAAADMPDRGLALARLVTGTPPMSSPATWFCVSAYLPE
jgi:hypothetical protein